MGSSVQQFEVSQLRVDVFDESLARHSTIVSDVSFALRPGQGLGITGESGSGKTTLSLALSGLLPTGSRVWADKFQLQLGPQAGNGLNKLSLLRAGEVGKQLHGLRGRHIFTLFQEPRASLNPYRKIGWQLDRCLRRNRVLSAHLHSGNQQSVPARRDNQRSAISVHHSPVSALAEVGLDPDVLRCYPHELSTGMCQRVLLAMARLLGSGILIADEPFASVDAQTRTRLAELVRQWKQTHGLLLVLVSHDLSLLRQLTNQVMVVYRGQVAEVGATSEVLARDKPVHPYTWLLGQVADSVSQPPTVPTVVRPVGPLARCWFAPRCPWADSTICTEAVPSFRDDSRGLQQSLGEVAVPRRLRCVRHPITTANLPQHGSGEASLPGGSEQQCLRSDRSGSREAGEQEGRGEDQPGSGEVLRVAGLAKEFRTGLVRRRTKTVLEDVSFSLFEGERLGIMGPSGQGKTTLGRIVLGLQAPTQGSLQVFAGERWDDVSQWLVADRMGFRQWVQMLYQDADLVLDPAQRVGDALVEAYQVFDPRIDRGAAYRLAAGILEELALPASLLEAYPYRLSGGERKRIALARVLAAFGCPFPARPGDPWRLLVLDEPTAGIDVVLQAILTRFLIWVQHRLRLCYLVISHDEAFVHQFCHRVLRMENGRVRPADILV